MQTTTNIIQEISRKIRIPQEQVKKTITSLLEIIKEKLKQGETMTFKGYFVLSRGSIQPQKGSKNCSKHEKALNEFKEKHKGEGLAAFTQEEFRNLTRETRKCESCKSKKEQLDESKKLTNRINFRPSESFWF